MLQVLQLISGQGDLQTRRSSKILREALGGDFSATCRSIGRGGEYRNLAHAAVSLRAGWGLPIELVHVWDLPAFVAAVCSALPIVFSPSVPLTSRAARWLRLAAPRHSVHVVASTEAQRATWVRWGAARERSHVIAPAVRPGDRPRVRDERFRERLGFASDDLVVVAPGESTGTSEHWRAVWAVSILHVLDPRYRILLWGRGRDVHVATNLARRLGQERLLTVAERRLGREIEFEELLAACDVALVAAQGDVPMLPVLSCMAASVPVVASENRTTLEFLRRDLTALVVSGGAPRELAQAILRLREQPALARKLANAAALDVASRFSPTRFAEEMRRIYWAAGMTGGDPPAIRPAIQAGASGTH
jgi:glycosyltransferase involved in cell wall biosynthesis